MNQIKPFEGFFEETINFYKQLADNNSKEWFESHRGDYEQYVLEPSRSFVVDLGQKLNRFSPDIHAEPRINRSLFKIHRDIRFSKDKRPLKTHLAFYFWSGNGPRMEMPGFYFHLEPGKIFLATGMYLFTKDQLKIFRESVADDKFGKRLEKIVGELEKREGTSVGTLHYKKVPRGFESNHPREKLLRFNGVHAGREFPEDDILFNRKLLDLCVEEYKPMLALHNWCLEMIARME